MEDEVAEEAAGMVVAAEEEAASVVEATAGATVHLVEAATVAATVVGAEDRNTAHTRYFPSTSPGRKPKEE